MFVRELSASVAGCIGSDLAHVVVEFCVRDLKWWQVLSYRFKASYTLSWCYICQTTAYADAFIKLQGRPSICHIPVCYNCNVTIVWPLISPRPRHFAVDTLCSWVFRLRLKTRTERRKLNPRRRVLAWPRNLRENRLYQILNLITTC